MRHKFPSYAGNLADTELYDQQMVAAVTETLDKVSVFNDGYQQAVERLLKSFGFSKDQRSINDSTDAGNPEE